MMCVDDNEGTIATNEHTKPHRRTSSYPPQIIYEEKSKSNCWINCHDVLNFISTSSSGDYQASSLPSDGDAHLTVGSEVKFLWSSEESGYRHLYLVSVHLVAHKNSALYSDLSQFAEYNIVDSSSSLSSSTTSSTGVVNHQQHHNYVDNEIEKSSGINYSSQSSSQSSSSRLLCNANKNMPMKSSFNQLLSASTSNQQSSAIENKGKRFFEITF